MKKYNYEKSIINFAKSLQLGEPFWSGDSLQMLCPFHIEENASFGINTKNGLYNCFACNSKGHFSKIINNLKGNIIAEKHNSIKDFEISAKIDTVSYSAKPERKEVGAIRNRLDTISYSKYTINELIVLLTSGHTVSLSGVNSGENWICQQACMIDLDNEYQGLTMEEVINYAKSINLEPTFAYYTYSSTENCPRFRLTYVFKEPITDKEMYSAIILKLIDKFMKYSSDASCKDFSRLFYGTMNKNVYLSNCIYYTRFTAEQLSSSIKKSKSIGISKTSATLDNAVISSDVAEYFVGRKFLKAKFVEDFKKKYIFIKLNNLPYIYDTNKNLYVEGLNSGIIEDLIVTSFPSLTIKQIEEVVYNIQHSIGENLEECDYNYIGFQNGILNLSNMQFVEPTPDIIITSKLNVNYTKPISDTNSVVDKFFNDICCNNHELVILLYCIIGCACCAMNKFHKTFVFYGKGGNGKGTFFDIVKEIAGSSAGSINLKQLSNDKYGPAFLLGKTVNICDDERITNKIDTEIIKSLLAEGWVNGQVKYGHPFDFKPVATFLIGTNFTININDTTDAIERRFVIIPMNAKFSESKNNLDVNMFEKLKSKENLEYIVYKAMQQFSQVLRLGKFPIPKIVEDETNRQLLENNNIKQFVIDNPFKRELPLVVYEKYKDYCNNNNLEPVSNKVFGDIIKNTEFNDIKYQKKKLTDPETGKQKYYYVSNDYNIKETYNPMVSLYGDDYIDNLINAIETHQLSNEEFNILKEHIDSRSLEYPDFDFEIDAEALEDLEK